MIYKLSPRFILAHIKKKLSLMRQLFLLYCRGHHARAPTTDCGPPIMAACPAFSDRAVGIFSLLGAEDAVAGIA